MREALLPANRVKAVKTEPNINARKFDCMYRVGFLGVDAGRSLYDLVHQV